MASWDRCYKDGDTMIFECADGVFCCISSVDMWRYQLIIDLFCGHERLKESGSFVVELLEEWSETLG
jgi:hypothetical protein